MKWPNGKNDTLDCHLRNTWNFDLSQLTDVCPSEDPISDGSSIADDFDGSDDDDVIHVIRRRPEVSDQVIEFDPISGDAHKGIIRHRMEVVDRHSHGTKLADLFHRVRTSERAVSIGRI